MYPYACSNSWSGSRVVNQMLAGLIAVVQDQTRFALPRTRKWLSSSCLTCLQDLSLSAKKRMQPGKFKKHGAPCEFPE